MLRLRALSLTETTQRRKVVTVGEERIGWHVEEINRKKKMSKHYAHINLQRLRTTTKNLHCLCQVSWPKNFRNVSPKCYKASCKVLRSKEGRNNQKQKNKSKAVSYFILLHIIWVKHVEGR